jgi:hypothetical protein
MDRLVNAINRMPPIGLRVMIIPFADGRQMNTSGGGTTWEYFEVDELEPIRYFGPWISSITAHTKLNAISANGEWKLVFLWSVDGKGAWTGPLDLFAATATIGQVIQASYTTRTNFGIQMRYAIGVRATSGTAVANANVSGYLALEFVT